jgi:hypothetical protein
MLNTKSGRASSSFCGKRSVASSTSGSYPPARSAEAMASTVSGSSNSASSSELRTCLRLQAMPILRTFSALSMTSSPACRPSRNSRFRPAGYKAAAAEIEYKIAQNHPMSILFFLNFQEAVFHAPDGPPGYFFHPA